MYPTVDKSHIINGVELGFDVCFGNSQMLIDKNAYYMGDGKGSNYLDEIIYLCGKNIVCYELMKKKQSFVTRRPTDGEVTAMNFYYYNKGGSTPTSLVAVALKSSDAECPSVVIHNKSEHTSTHLVFSEVPPKNDVTNLSFVGKGRFLAALVELEPNIRYNLLVWSLQNNLKSIKNEILEGKYSKIEPCLVEHPFFSVSSDKNVIIYQVDSNASVVNVATEHSKSVADGLTIDEDDSISDHCWLKGENKLIVATNYKIYIFDSYKLEEVIPFEYPAMDMKKLIKERSVKGETPNNLYQSVEYLIEYITPTSGEDISMKKSSFLNAAISEQLSKRNMNQAFDSLKDDEKLKIMKALYSTCSRKILNEKNIRINCMCRQEEGFALGFRGLGLIVIYKKRREGFVIDSTSIVKNKDIEAICSLSSAHDDNHIVVTMKIGSRFTNSQDGSPRGQRGGTTSGSLEIVVFNSSLVNTIKNSSMEPFEFLFPYNTHSAEITDVALVPSKSFAATVSRDKTLKLWQYSGDQKQLSSNDYTKDEYSKHKIVFDVHPLAIQVAIGFSRGLKIYFLVEGETDPAYEKLDPACNAIAYSSRGHLLATAFGGEILIMDPYSFERIFSIKSHSGEIKNFSWVGRDRYLVSLCTKSNFQVRDTWDRSFKVHFDEGQLGMGTPPIHAVAYDAEFDQLVCCTDTKVYVHSYGKSDPFAVEDKLGDGVYFTTVLICKKLQVIFFGTNHGAVRIYLWPLIWVDRNYESTQRFVHLKEITSLKITPNFEYLVTTSADCSIYFLKIKEIQKGKNVTVTDALNVLSEQKDAEVMSRISNAFSLNEFSFMSNKMQKELLKRMNELESDLQNKITEIDEDNEKLTAKHNREIQEKENQNLEELKKMNIELATKMDEEGSKQKNLELQCKEFKTKLKDMVKEKEEQHREQLLELYAEREDIERKMKAYSEEKDKDLLESKSRFDSDMEKINTEFEKNKQQINKQYAQAIFYLKEDRKKFHIALNQSEDEYHTLINKTESELKKNLDSKKKLTDEIKTKHKKLMKDNLKNTERYANLQKLIEETATQNKQLKNDIEAFKVKYREMEARLNEQEDVINKKEAKIKEFRNKNYHLQNFKSVYDYEVTTLKEAHEPLTEYVDNLEKHIKTMYNELLTEADSSKALETNIDNLDTQIVHMKKMVQAKDSVLRNTRRHFDVMEHDLATFANIQNEDEFKSLVKNKLEEQLDYVVGVEKKLALTDEGGVAEGLDQKKGQSLEKLSAVELEAIRKELTRQRDTMSKKLIRNTEINVRLEKERENVFKSIQEEGKMLIKKCNILRRAGLILKYKIGISEKRAKDLNDELNTLEHKEEDIQKQMQLDIKKKGPKKSNDLPYIEYRKKQVVKKPVSTLQESDEFEAMDPAELVKRMMDRHEEVTKKVKEVEELYQDTKKHNKDAMEQYQRANNFVNDS